MGAKHKGSARDGLDKEPAGGRWEGASRSKQRPRMTLAHKSPDPGFTWSGLPSDLFFLLTTFGVALIGFLITSSFIAEATGEGTLLLVLSLLVALALPAGVAFWAVRPLSRRRAYHWWLGVFAAPYLLATLALCVAAPARTARMLRWHGAWPARLLGRNSPSAKRMQTIVDRAAALLSALPRGGGKIEAPSTAEDAAPGPQPPPPYLGRIRPGRQAATIPEDFGRRPGHKVHLKQRSGVWSLTATATKRRLPLSLLLDAHQPWTILTREAAARLGIPIPAKGASLEMRGSDRPVIILDRLFLGGLEAKDVTVVLCSECVPAGVSGLLGRNLLRRFQVSVDRKKGLLTVTPRNQSQNIPEDLDPFLILDKVQAKRREDLLFVSGQAKNISALPMGNLSLTITFHDAADRITERDSLSLGSLDAGSEKSFQKLLSPPDTTSGFRIRLSTGRWESTAARARRAHRRRRHGASPNKRRARAGRASSR